MRRQRTVPLGLADVARLPAPCLTCVFWELDDAAVDVVRRSGDTTLEKEAWLSGVLLESPAAGRVALMDSDVVGSEVVGFVVWAPPAQVPRSTTFPSSPVSADAVLLTSLQVIPSRRGIGLGRSLVRAAVGDLSQSGVRAVEAFGWAGPIPTPCLLPAAFLRAVGFREVGSHPRTPRLRLDVTAALPTFAEVEARVNRLRSAFRAAPRRRRIAAPGPAPAPVPVPSVTGQHPCIRRVDGGVRSAPAGAVPAVQPASSDSRIIPVGASASAGR